ncbi:hypothetical protein DPMN_124188 [Dreissena polymorpha]|uniref:Uncharacterized protein n=1 Tax=Dreissena polymorpha TaxID=45954 RepID=A0A9D4JRZ0_DREPO|nr:hypothetical protein DPMN_124188 [Dreissena polymorpha]
MLTDPQLGSKQCEVSCTDGTCIVQTQLCDGSNNCEDGKDEFNCLDSGTRSLMSRQRFDVFRKRPDIFCKHSTCSTQKKLAKSDLIR